MAGIERSPCFACERKDYAGGCSVGCEEHEAYQARKKQGKEKYRQETAVKELLIDRSIKYNARAHRRGRKR